MMSREQHDMAMEMGFPHANPYLYWDNLLSPRLISFRIQGKVYFANMDEHRLMQEFLHARDYPQPPPVRFFNPTWPDVH